MKIKIDKTYTEKWQEEKVKADLNEFKECYTDGDLLWAFMGAMNERGEECPDMNTRDITVCNVKAFPAGRDFADENGIQPTHYEIEMTVENPYREIDKIRFYTDNALSVSLYVRSFGETLKMYDIKRFILQD